MATMFPCPNCGGQLRFSPKDQNLKCSSCGEITDINGYTPDEKIGTDKVVTNIYTCPNCAGEIQLIDNDGMEFCPYCGTQATMQEKFSTEGAPRYILPFQLSKKQARNKYKKHTEGIHFAPDGLESEENIDKLVGMYVPYYLYEYSINDEVAYKGSATHSSGDYYITDYANVKVDVNVEKMKVPFDASQTLDDSIAAQLEPFPMDSIKDFHPGYLAGYFVENSTVDNNLYEQESKDKAVEYLNKQVIQNSKGYAPLAGSRYDFDTQLTNDIRYDGSEGAYLPMYFLTTRYNDRVAYSVINGASGNTYMDMPIEKHKMFRTAGAVSAAIFVALVLGSFILSFSFKVKTLCAFGALFSSLIALIGASLADKTYRNDQHLDDKGYFASIDNLGGKDKKFKTRSQKSYGGLFIIVLAIAITIFGTAMSNFELVFDVLPYIMYPVSAIIVITSLFKVKKGKKTVMLLGILGWALAVAVRLINLPNDIFYYSALIVTFLVIIFAMNAVVDEYNRFATHPSPQFLKKGGRLENARD